MEALKTSRTERLLSCTDFSVRIIEGMPPSDGTRRSSCAKFRYWISVRARRPLFFEQLFILQSAVVIPVAVHLALFGLADKLFERDIEFGIAAFFSEH